MEKLEEYRLRKRKKERLENFKRRFYKMIPFYNQDLSNNCIVDVHEDNPTAKQGSEKSITSSLLSKQNESETDHENENVHLHYHVSDDENEDVDENAPTKYTIKEIMNKIFNLKVLFRIILFIFWVTCYAIAIQLKFGVVFLMLSALFGIYFNTRTGPKQSDEISAYSVFNKNCHAIDGTLKGEQFEQEIRYGAATVRF